MDPVSRYCVTCGFDVIGRYCGRCGHPQPSTGAPYREDVNYKEVIHQVEDAIESGEAEGDVVIFEGTTWPKCLCSPLCCSTVHWRVTTQRLDWEYGCCRAHIDTLDLRRIKDIAYRANCLQVCSGRGTIHIWADDDGATSHVTITRRKGQQLYKEIRRVWTNSNTDVA